MIEWIAPGLALALTGLIVRDLFRIGGRDANLPRSQIGVAAIALLTVSVVSHDRIAVQSAILVGLIALFFATRQVAIIRERLLIYRDRLDDLSRQIEETSESASSAIAGSERRFRQLARVAPVGIFEMNARWELRYVSRLWRRITGLEKGAAHELSLISIVHPEDRPEIERAIARALETGTRFEDVFRLSRNDDQVVWVTMVAMPVEHDDASLGWVGTVLDVTEKRAREIEREELRARLERSSRMESLGTLAAGLAHELNNRLVPILGSSEEMLRELPADSPARRSAEIISRAALRAAEVAGRLLSYAGVEAGADREVDLRNVVADLRDEFQASHPDRIDTDIEDSQLVVLGDRERLQEALRGIVVNAIEAMSGRPGTIRMELGMTALGPREIKELSFAEDMKPGAFAVFRVSDRGPGFPAELLDRAFDPFSSSKLRGRGLGLLTVAGLARALGGGVDLESVAGQGARVRLYLPLSGDGTESENPNGVVLAETRRRKIAARNAGGLILIIDDQPEVRGTMRSTLEHAGYEVIEAGDGLVGIEAVERHRNRLRAVLLDLTMPVMDGEEVFLWLGAHAAEIPVLVLSGFGERELVRRITEVGRKAAFLRKPFLAEELGQSLARLLEQSDLSS